jgi:hypothetical protein
MPGRVRESAVTLLVTAQYLALTYLMAFAVRIVVAGFIHPIAREGWELRYAIAVGVLELLAAVIATLVSTQVALSLSERPLRALVICGGIAMASLLFWPSIFTAAATTPTIVWTGLVHGLAPASVGWLYRSERH